ncbi:MAG: hypothetical protein QG656_650 [Candidatus Hydrogenedentes bacterium]|nr:hypothetical protein [Candidatus Hydrogenedentota bacterium]
MRTRSIEFGTRAAGNRTAVPRAVRIAQDRAEDAPGGKRRTGEGYRPDTNVSGEKESRIWIYVA